MAAKLAGARYSPDSSNGQYFKWVSAIEKWKRGKKVIIFKNLKQTEDFLRSVKNN